ncbi:pyrimidine-specific ribonucleoside hydrolase RihA [Phytohabitans suffuscus]|uniref:Pyrimidine-specific ribonucleoside hydrolase RihA n=2 Tax=Phytohabitans suffuscus TaxID=624315 RepID=A0A6F8YQ64_9ACTN|nr:pyrimidine-specific ribonucleoside hydrolase RihA [Phytohabitans suffuscus]
MILDCDPGHDDALAIMLAAADPHLDLLAITTVAGNTTLDKATLNARRVCTVAGISGVPVAAGCDRPLVAKLRIADDIHGESGLDGPAFGEPSVPLAGEHAVALMRRLLLDHPEPVTLVPTGPLTNIATLLRDHPSVRPRIREIVLMGGSTGRGNITPYGEFNIFVDPEAADIVFHSGLPVTMIGLNVTHQALVTPEVVARIRALDTPLAEVCVELMTFFGSTYERVFGLPEPPLHDPIAVARVIAPGMVRCVDAPVAVELTGAHTRGATVVDLHRRTGAAPNAQVALALDVPRFWDLLVGALTTLPGPRDAASPW